MHNNNFSSSTNLSSLELDEGNPVEEANKINSRNNHPSSLSSTTLPSAATNSPSSINFQQPSNNTTIPSMDDIHQIDPSPLITSQGDGDSSTRYTDDMTSYGESYSEQELINSQGAEKPNAAANNNNNGEEPHTLSPPTWHDTFFHPFSSTKQFFTELSSFFSWEFLSWMAIQQCFISGGVFALVMSLGLPLFKELGIDASRQQLYMTMIFAPWAMKPFIGVARVYHAGSAEAAIAAGPEAVQNFADWIVICFTAVSYEAATLDILGEGKYSELMRKYPESGSSIISFKFGWSLLGSIITQSFVGPMSDAGYFHVLFWIALMLSITPFYPTLVGWIPEKKRTKDEPGMTKLCSGCLFDKGSFQEKKTPFLIITACGLSAPIMAAVTTYASLGIGLAVSAALLVAFTAATYFIFPPTFFKVTADATCLPHGPHFDYTYYITITGIVGSVVNFVGVILYQNFLSGWRFRSALIFTIVIGALAPMIDLIIVMRWNVKIGIPDKVFFLLGNAIFENLVGILQSIPFSSIFAKIAPPGMESAVFAYTVGIANFCGMVSNLLGSGVIKWSGMSTVGEDCNFDSLPNLIVIFSILIPTLIGIPATFLIPNVLQTENMIDWEKEQWYVSEHDGEEPQSEADVENNNADNDRNGGDSRIESHLL
eukprot:scaffold5181_cov148-Skeletonema_menzelii.AAC.9